MTWEYYFLLLITFVQSIYNYIPETNRISRVYSVAAVLLLQFAVHVMLFSMMNVLHFYVITFRSMYVCMYVLLLLLLLLLAVVVVVVVVAAVIYGLHKHWICYMSYGTTDGQNESPSQHDWFRDWHLKPPSYVTWCYPSVNWLGVAEIVLGT